MSKVTGVIEKVTQNKGGFYALLVDGNWYGAGKSAPPCSEGDTVEFAYKMNGNFKNVDEKTLKTVSGGSSSSSSSSGSTASTKNSTQDRITWQGSQNTAVAFLNAAIAAEAIPLPKDNKKRAKVLEEAFVRYQEMFYRAACGQSNEVVDAVDYDDDVPMGDED